MTDEENIKYNTSQFELNSQVNSSTGERKFKPGYNGASKEVGIKITVKKAVVPETEKNE